MTPQSYQQLLAQADCLYRSAEIELAIASMAAQAALRLADANPVLLCVMNGGLPFAAKFCLESPYPLQMDYVHVTRYGEHREGRELQWLAKPAIALANRTVLVLDDILDEGLTLDAIKRECYQLGATTVLSAVLFVKERGEAATFTADFTGLPVPNRFVFGYGMDVSGYGRNLPAVYAVKAA